MGAYAVNSQISVALYFNNVEYPLDSGNILNFLHMSSSVMQLLPTIHFSITDIGATVSSIPDGIPIQIVIKVGDNKTNTYNFRKFHNKRTLDANGYYTYEIDGYWDAPLYWSGTSNLGMTGTSNDVLQQIATMCGLDYDGESTSDSQLWLQQNKTYGMFATFIKEHGYINSTSCMAMGVDLNGTLIYANVNNTANNETYNIVAYQSSPTAYTAMEYRAAANSGFTNLVSGYASGVITQSVVAPGVAPPPTTQAELEADEEAESEFEDEEEEAQAAISAGSSAIADVTGLVASTVADVNTNISYANSLAPQAIALCTTAAAAAAASGIASAASAASSPTAMNAVNKAINIAIQTATKAATNEVQALIKKATEAKGLQLASLPTFGANALGATSTPKNSIVFTPDVSAPLINTSIISEVKRGSYMYSGVDAGNTHAAYDVANYQNLRYSNLFSMGVELLLTQPTTLQLLDTINFSAPHVDGSADLAYSGLYQISSRVIYIQGATYAEKLLVVRNGTNDQSVNA